MGKGGSSFLTSLPGILTALGTLVAASAGLIALFVSSNSGKPLPFASTTPVATASPSNSGSTPSGNGSASGGSGSTGGGGGSTGDGGVSTGGGSVSTGGGGGGSGGSGSTGGGGVSTGGGGSSSGGGGGGTGGPAGPVISGVRFTGSTAAPTVIVSGTGFGAGPPTGEPDNSTSCGSYTNNGDDYGDTGLWLEDVSNFAAGKGTPPNGSCIGINVLSWSSHQLIYQFGNAYNSFDHWYLSTGDQYIVSVRGAQYTGTVSFS